MINNRIITIVIVFYKCTLDKSAAFRSLDKQISNNLYKLVLFNNDVSTVISHNVFEVVNSKENVMLAGAYNYALELSRNNNSEWILLVDQDSEIPSDYLIQLENDMKNIDSDVVAIVPRLISSNRILSPKLLNPFLWTLKDIPNNNIYSNCRIVGFNSMCLINVKFLVDIGGFSYDYPLDMLDHWYFEKIYKSGKKIYVNNCQILHSLSVDNYEKNVSLERHFNFLSSEVRFANELGKLYLYLFKMKLVLRVIKQLLKYRNKSYAFMTFKFIFKR
jgi:GT2 family glycosyltransferase